MSFAEVNYKQYFFGLRNQVIKNFDATAKVLEHAPDEQNYKRIVLDFVLNLVEQLQTEFPEARQGRSQNITATNKSTDQAIQALQQKVDMLISQSQLMQQQDIGKLSEQLGRLETKVMTVDRNVKCMTLMDGGSLTLHAMLNEKHEF